MTDLSSLKVASRTLASVHPELKLLVLFGSRARGENDPTSDWDVAFLSEPKAPTEHKPFWFPGAELLDTLSQLLHPSEDVIDLVNLSTCSDILAHFVARDGQVIYEKTPGEFAQFQQQALKTKGELKAFRQVQREQVHQALERWGV
ncbi:MAG: nucleotidyltransferase domain-containing protein [Kaiparowitsia implicata GSE-PSE-MK54-09C]|jgi:predicted nucleotidyltransferase|nr:nucleotidyltransferase domain-containing protein [Kaiparowitsia implicata GSE-PSE-MK54-09C]